MKKTVFLLHAFLLRKRCLFFALVLSLVSASSYINASGTHDTFMCDTRVCDGALSAGYVFKHDYKFKDVYGHGMVNIITADGCYYPLQLWGIGAKISYWRAHGHTTFIKRHTTLQEVPVTLYVRRVKDFCCGVRAYVSLGGGVAWIKEKSYLGHAQLRKGIGEVEIGVNCPVWRGLNITGAVRYLFPRQSSCGTKVDVGGCDLRAGIGYSF